MPCGTLAGNIPVSLLVCITQLPGGEQGKSRHCCSPVSWPMFVLQPACCAYMSCHQDKQFRASVEILKQCCGLNPLLFYGCEEQEQVKDEADISLLPTIVERVVLPKLTVISENIWDPFSTTQTCRVVAIVQKPVDGYPSVVNAENKNTQMLLKALLLRMRRTLDADVFMPFYPKNILENKNSGPYLFFQRQFWSSGKLLGNFLQWYGILSNQTLQELCIDGLLNRHILMAFQNSEYGEDSMKKAQSWFSNLRGDKTISQLENSCRYLAHLADTIYRHSIGCSDVEKRNAREHIQQVIKLLASTRALDHAVTVANDHNVKEVKILIEGKETFPTTHFEL
ncbi:PAX3- and PAX7-binding protein 1-like isoform X1 [Pithys albifrons albifrons]|uniref:PAX3- and PAX7-binding protein 1-like isoform X1 n=1 Tax=Pithys albifrons albifrons TaxID=3385563 RepID=UPI003A5D18DE